MDKAPNGPNTYIAFVSPDLEKNTLFSRWNVEQNSHIRGFFFYGAQIVS